MQRELTVKKTSAFWTFVWCVLVTLGLGTLSGWLSGSMNGYEGINMPSFALPDWVYGVVWTVLYVMIGIALFLIINTKPLSRTEQNIKTASIILWFAQFALNLLWPFIFFNVDYTAAFVIVAVMVAIVTSLVTLGFFIKPLASVMLLPYWGWLLFAAIQTLMVIALNA